MIGVESLAAMRMDEATPDQKTTSLEPDLELSEDAYIGQFNGVLET